MIDKIKNLGQVCTPVHIVNDILDLIDYKGEQILKKHIIDNSCGQGAFLQQIIERYIKEYVNKNKTCDGVENELSIYIHGIEIDENEYQKCIENLNNFTFWQSIKNVKWDILNADALTINLFDNKMDYVVGNPPYVRIHNLKSNFYKLRNYEFCKFGMADLYIIFYEIGFAMLNNKGKLCYITPNSFYSSLAGQSFRNFIIDTKHLYSIIDLGHYQPFKVTTYTTICAFDWAKQFENFQYSKYTNDGNITFEECLNLHCAFNNGKMILAKKREQNLLKDIQNYIPKNKKSVIVKNGFATLNDSIFIGYEFEFTQNVIDIIKASTGEWKKCFFPYDDNGKIIPFEKLDKRAQTYLVQHKSQLLDRNLNNNGLWYAFGRSQAILDVTKQKYAINTTIKDIASIKINKVGAGQGVYSGLYIITDIQEEELNNYIKSTDFIDYITILGKCKSGGYYTFSSFDLKQFLIYKVESENE